MSQRRQQYVFRPNHQNPLQRQAWQILQKTPAAERRTLVAQAIVLGNARIRENTVTHIAPVVTGQSVVMGDLAGSVMVFDRGYILPGQTVDNPSRHMIGINERGAAIVRDCTHALARDSKNRNTPER